MRRILLASSLITVTLPVFAGEVYTSLGVGFSQSSEVSGAMSDALIGALGAGTTTNEDAVGTSWQLGVGYRFTEHLAIEAAYVDLGKINVDGSHPINGSINTSSWSHGYRLSLGGEYPLGPIQLGGRIGGYVSENSYSANNLNTVSKSTKPMFGLSLGYTLPDEWVGSDYRSTLQLGLDRYLKVGDESGTINGAVDNITLNLRLTYR